MTCISLICTVHSEHGLANVPELVAILERVRPEVIFLELPGATFDDHAHSAHSNLDPTAARQYRAIHHVELFPVDLSEPDEYLIRDTRYWDGRIKRTSAQYRALIHYDDQRTQAEGFAYLNSEDCCQLWSACHEETLATLAMIRDDHAANLYTEWRQTHDARENAMLQNIRDYYEQNPFNVGAFLVGSAHRQPLIDKIRAGSSTTIDWDVSGFLQTP